MLSVLLALFATLSLCELPPAGYRFPLVSTAPYTGLAGDAKFQRAGNLDLVTFTVIDGLSVVNMVNDPSLSSADFPSRSFTQTVENSRFGRNPLFVSTVHADGVSAAFVDGTGILHVFAGDYVWSYLDSLLTDPQSRPATWSLRGVDNPRLISMEFPGVPNSPDAVFELPNGHIYFFKNGLYYLIKDFQLYTEQSRQGVLPCYPKDIHQEFADLPADAVIHDAYYSATLRQIVFLVESGGALSTFNFADKYVQHHFKDTLQAPVSNPAKVVACVSAADVPVDPVPTTFDTIFQRKTGKIYIFQGDSYWRLTDKDFTPHQGDCLDKGYPKKIADNFKSFDPVNSPLPTTWGPIFQRSNGKIYLFSGTSYYRFTDKYLNPEADPTLPDELDAGYPKELVEFGIKEEQYDGKVVVGAFQRPNGKIFIFLKDTTTSVITYFRITDKYIVGGSDDIVDPGWDTTVGGKLLSEGFMGEPGTDDIDNTTDFTGVYQRVESNQLIYFIQGDKYRPANDKYLRIPSVCTACNPTDEGQ